MTFMGKKKPFHEKTYVAPAIRHAMVDNLLGQLEEEQEAYNLGFKNYELLKDCKDFDTKNWMIQQFIIGKSMAVLSYLRGEYEEIDEAYREILNEISATVGIEGF